MNFKKAKILFISVMVLLSIVLPATSASAIMEQYSTKRLGGNTRFDTAIEISKEFVAKNRKPVDTVVLCTAYGYADSVSVTPFAVYVNAPILLTDKDYLTTSTKARIEEMKVKNTYIIGGTGVISDNVMSELASMGLTVERIGGINRFETNRAILAKIPQDLWAKNPKFVDAYDVFAGLAVTVDTIDKDDMNKLNPIILIDDENDTYTIECQYNKDIVSMLYDEYGEKNFYPYTSRIVGYDLMYLLKGEILDVSYIDELTTSNVQLKSTEPANGSAFFSQNKAAKVNSKFASKFNSHPYATNSVLMTTGKNYVDAICAGPLSAITYSPMIFVSSESDNVLSYRYYKKDYVDIQNIYYIGGNGVVPDGSEKILK